MGNPCRKLLAVYRPDVNNPALPAEAMFTNLSERRESSWKYWHCARSCSCNHTDEPAAAHFTARKQYSIRVFNIPANRPSRTFAEKEVTPVPFFIFLLFFVTNQQNGKRPKNAQTNISLPLIFTKEIRGTIDLAAVYLKGRGYI